MRSKRVTITDLAQTLQLSTCTVSKVLNRSFDGFTYSEATIKRVNAKAKAMGYVPNAQARSLRTRKTMLVVLLLPSAQSMVYGTLTAELEFALRRKGYQVLIAHTQNDPKTEKELIRFFLARGVDGLLWVPTLTKIDIEELGIAFPFPTVLIHRLHSPHLPFVGSNNEEACEELAKKMLNLGHKSLAVLQSSKNDRSMKERLKGFSNIYGGALQVLDIPNDSDFAKEAAVKLLLEPKRPTALVALSDLLAIGALAGLHKLGLRIGPDVSFATFDEFPLAARWSPPITLIRSNQKEIAETAVRLLLEYIRGKRREAEQIRLPAELQWRESVMEANPDR